MAHKRKDTLANTIEWWKHLRPAGKRRQAKAERRAATKLIRNDQTEAQDGVTRP